MGILDTQNLNDSLLSNFEGLDNQRAPFGKRGQYNAGENPSSNQYFGGFSYAADETTREAFGTDAKSTRRGPIGNPMPQGDDFKYGTEGQARLSTSQSTVLTQAAKMTSGQRTDFGSEGTAAQIAMLWTSSNQLRNLRNTLNGSGKEASGYDANHSYGISNWNIDVDAVTDDIAAAFVNAEQGEKTSAALAVVDKVGEGGYAGVNEGATEVYRPQVTMKTGLRNINGIREGHPMSRSADVTTALQEKVAELMGSGDDATSTSQADDLGYSSGRA